MKIIRGLAHRSFEHALRNLGETSVANANDSNDHCEGGFVNDSDPTADAMELAVMAVNNETLLMEMLEIVCSGNLCTGIEMGTRSTEIMMTDFRDHGVGGNITINQTMQETSVIRMCAFVRVGKKFVQGSAMSIPQLMTGTGVGEVDDGSRISSNGGI